jgi:hypothetical protein
MSAGVPTANLKPADDSPESSDSGSDERAMVGLSRSRAALLSVFDNRSSTDRPDSRLTGSLPVRFASRYIAIR